MCQDDKNNGNICNVNTSNDIYHMAHQDAGDKTYARQDIPVSADHGYLLVELSPWAGFP